MEEIILIQALEMHLICKCQLLTIIFMAGDFYNTVVNEIINDLQTEYPDIDWNFEDEFGGLAVRIRGLFGR